MSELDYVFVVSGITRPVDAVFKTKESAREYVFSRDDDIYSVLNNIHMVPLWEDFDQLKSMIKDAEEQLDKQPD